MAWKKSLLYLVGAALAINIHCSFANTAIELTRLKEAYPDTLKTVSNSQIVWKNGKHIAVRTPLPFIDQISKVFLNTDRTHSDNSITIKDLQCDNYEPFFKKMYGGTASEVKKRLVTIYWMPKIFGERYPLRVTTVNDVDKKLRRISAALEKLPPSYFKYLDHPAGSFYWRNVKHETYLSSHSFGIALDINSHYGNYWMWDWERAHRTSRPIQYHNNIPMEIVRIFEREGFLWGGRWYYYDTMHFEYRPELFAQDSGLYNNQLGMRCKA